MTEQFEFIADVEWNDQIAEDIESQVVEEVRRRYGRDKSGDDVEDFGYTLKVNVTMKEVE